MDVAFFPVDVYHAEKSRRKHVNDSQNGPKHKSRNIGQKSEDSCSGEQVPQMVVTTILKDAVDEKELAISKDTLAVSLLKTNSNKESLRTIDYQLRRDEAGAGITQTKLVHTCSAVEEASLLDVHGLAKRLDVEMSREHPECIGTTKKGLKCTRGISKSSRIKVIAILKRLATLDICSQTRSCSEDLWLLACLVLCKKDHQDQAANTVKLWKVPPSCCGQPTDDSTSERSFVETQTPSHGSKYPSSTVESVSVSFNTSVDTNFLSMGHSGSRICIRKFEPYNTKTTSRIDREELIERTLRRDLLPSEATIDGFIYIYWFEGNFGHIKIGVTGRTPEERLHEWRRDCGHEPRLEYPKPSEERQRIPHVFRVEALVQAQLQAYRRRELRCKGCGRSHTEWFEGALPEAIAAVKKWSAWMKKEPYAMDVTQVWNKKKKEFVDKPTGKLKSQYEQNIRTLCRVVPNAADTTAFNQLPRTGLRPPFLGSNGNRFRAYSAQPMRRSDRLAKKRRNRDLVNGEDNGPKFSDEFLSFYKKGDDPFRKPSSDDRFVDTWVDNPFLPFPKIEVMNVKEEPGS